MRGLGQAGDGVRRQRRLMAQVIPVLAGAGQVGQVGALAITYIEEVGEHRHPVALLAAAQQLGHRHLQVLAEQVEQRRLDCGYHVVQAQVDLVGLLEYRRLGCGGHLVAGVAAIAGEHRAQAVEHPVVGADRLADDQRAATLQCLTDALATGYFADTGVAGIVGEQDQVAGEVGGVGAAEIEQHAVVAGHGYDLHALYAGRCTERLTHCARPPLQARRATGAGAVHASAEAARRMALSAASGCAGDGQLRNMSGASLLLLWL